MRIAFIDEHGTVQNVIVATGMSEATKQAFLDENHRLFGSVWMLEIDDDSVPVWSGGTYDNERGFQPPPQPEREPEPEAEIVEGTSEVIEEPAAMIEETIPEPEATEPEI
jgi:hypothetical protein